MNEIYQWRESSIKYIGDAQEIAEHIERLAELKGGGLTTDEIVADALDEQSPLHPNIEKDDKVAAHNWRKHQVRGLIGAIVRVTVEQTDTIEREITIRGFPHVDGLYRPSTVVLTDTQLDEAYKKILARDLMTMRRRMVNYDEFAGVVHAIDELPLSQLGDANVKQISSGGQEYAE